VAALAISEFRRLIVKVGSSLLVDADGRLNRDWLETLAHDVGALQKQGHEILIVSSGAIAIGSLILGINKRRARLEDLQAAAAAGQVQLVHAYQEVLGQHGIAAAQILLTPEDTENRRRFLNARGTLGRLIERGVIPVINENDTVATEEIRYGDNDRLAARVAQLVMADALILLSDVDGLYTKFDALMVTSWQSLGRPAPTSVAAAWQQRYRQPALRRTQDAPQSLRTGLSSTH
jgi:glutamate 5-kinase